MLKKIKIKANKQKKTTQPKTHPPTATKVATEFLNFTFCEANVKASSSPSFIFAELVWEINGFYRNVKKYLGYSRNIKIKSEI